MAGVAPLRSRPRTAWDAGRDASDDDNCDDDQDDRRDTDHDGIAMKQRESNVRGGLEALGLGFGLGVAVGLVVLLLLGLLPQPALGRFQDEGLDCKEVSHTAARRPPRCNKAPSLWRLDHLSRLCEL